MDLFQLYQRALKVSATAIVFGTESIYNFAETMSQCTGGMFVVVTEDLYDANKDEIKDKKIKTVVEQPFYTKLEYKKKPFAIVIPSGVKDIIREGESLSHCVASYVDDVIDEKCQIAFLRHAEEFDKPLITIEIRNNVLKQARGKSQKLPNEIESAFLKEWAEKKELHYGI
jgi:stalled ribosome alternative rescue factor ArfA